MKTRFTEHSRTHVTIRFGDVWRKHYPEMTEVTYWAADTGKWATYVRRTDTGKQICNRLNRLGPTLMLGRDERLIDLLRQEYRLALYDAQRMTETD